MSNETLAQQATTNQMANIKYGVVSQPMPMAGKTIGDVRNAVQGSWKVPGDAEAFKGKTKLDENYVIQPNDKIEFVRRLGEKG